MGFGNCWGRTVGKNSWNLTEINPWRSGLSFVEEDEPKVDLLNLTAQEAWEKYPDLCQRLVRERIQKLEKDLETFAARIQENAKVCVTLELRQREYDRQKEYAEIVESSRLPYEVKKGQMFSAMISRCESASELRELLQNLEQLHRIGPQSTGKSLDF